MEYGADERHLLAIFRGRKFSDGKEFNPPIKTVGQLVKFLGEHYSLPCIDGAGDVRNQTLWRALVLYLAGCPVANKWNEDPAP